LDVVEVIVEIVELDEDLLDVVELEEDLLDELDRDELVELDIEELVELLVGAHTLAVGMVIHPEASVGPFQNPTR
jgi:hypothetical protein